MAIRLAHRLEASRILDFIQLSEKLNISKLMIPDKIIGRTVLDVKFRKDFGVNIIAIEANGKLVENVRPEYVFGKGDIVFLSGSKQSLDKLADWAKRG